jgi:hypothetical protein
VSIIQHFSARDQDLAFSDGHAAFAEAAMYGTRELMSTIMLLGAMNGVAWGQSASPAFSGSCAARAGRPFVGAGYMSHTNPAGELDGDLTPLQGEALYITDVGRGLSLQAGLPVGPVWSIRVFGTAARAPVERRTLLAPGEVVHRRDGAIRTRRLTVGAMRHGGGRALCGYTVLGGTVYEFRYGDVTSHSFGGGAVAGVEVPLARWPAVAIELHVDFVYPNLRPPLSWKSPLARGFSAGFGQRC